MNLFEILEDRRQELAAIVTVLVEKQALDYDYELIRDTNTVPDSGGLYLFSQKDASVGEYLYAGKSANLRDRIGNQHLDMNVPSNMLGMVMRVHNLDKQQAKLWIRDNCRVRWVQVESRQLRAFAEDYMIAVLRPKWNHKMSSGLSSRRVLMLSPNKQ